MLKDLGIRTDRVLRRAGLPADLFSHPEQGLSTEEYFSFWRSLEAEFGDPLFPLRIVQTVSTESFDPPLFAALCSANLMQAAQRLDKYKQLMAPMKLEMEVSKRGELTLSPRWIFADGNVPHSLEVAELAFLVRLARMGTREPLRALRVLLPVIPEPVYARKYEEHFGVSVRRGVHPSVTFSAADAQRPFLTSNDAMWQAFEPELGRRLSDLEATATTAERVRALLLELLPSNAATIEVVAERLAMSKRTLQRRLEDEGENFRTLINSTRESLAKHYLMQTRMSGGEIAFLLGFEDPNSFYRAFHEWTGQTPEAVRRATT
nr:AraC family transcriptional regulator [Steroidobacter cummioxidans]